MSIPVYPEAMSLPSRVLPNEAAEFQQLKQQARQSIKQRFGVELAGAEVLDAALKFDAFKDDEDFALALPWLMEFTYHRVGGLKDDVKTQLPIWFWELLLVQSTLMGRWEGLRYVPEDTFYEGMMLFAKDKVNNDWQLIHYWRTKRTDELGSYPNEIIENMYRKHAAAK
jgi:hypothetical protein